MPSADAAPRDDLIRLRPHLGLRLERDGDALTAAALSALLGELTLTERALLSGTRLAGKPPTALLLVQHLDAYLDLARPHAGWCVAWLPRWDTPAAARLLARWPRKPAIFFSDLDPTAAHIQARLTALRPDLRWCAPAWWTEYPRQPALEPWPETPAAPPLITTLAAAGQRLAQAAILFDPRLPDSLAETTDGADA